MNFRFEDCAKSFENVTSVLLVSNYNKTVRACVYLSPAASLCNVIVIKTVHEHTVQSHVLVSSVINIHLHDAFGVMLYSEVPTSGHRSSRGR